MKNIMFLFCFFSFTNAVSANSIEWYKSLEEAKTAALEQNKLIFIDFWASGINVSKAMEDRVWSKEQVGRIMKDFIPVRIDALNNRKIVRKFIVEVLPTQIIVDAFENVLIKVEVELSAEEMMDLLLSFPADYSTIYQSLVKWQADKMDPIANFELGKAYQDNAELLSGDGHFILLEKSNFYYQRAERKAENLELEQKAKLGSALNLMYWNQFKKARKELKKITKKEEVFPSNKAWVEYIRVVGYLIEGEKKKAKSSYAKLDSLENGKYFADRLIELSPLLQSYHYIE